MKLSPKILFLLKRRQNYDTIVHSHIGLSTGLYNSASYINEMLLESGIDSSIEVVVDNNSIDRVVTKHKPTHVIIEALWVIPSKFYILTKLHPNVKWIIRLHSDIPFLSNEGIAMEWIGDYVGFENVTIAANSPRILGELRDFLGCKMRWSEKTKQERVIYLPNFYPQVFKYKKFDREKDYVDIGCFGAIRPMKNHLIQAMGALQFAQKIGKKLRFHINSGRVEQRGDTVLNNLKSMFEHLREEGHELINHQWSPRENFVEVCSQMDIGTQVSFSETFNIVCADMVSEGVPIIGSRELPWINPLFTATPTESEMIAKKLYWSYKFPYFNFLTNQYLLIRYTNEAINKKLPK